MTEVRLEPNQDHLQSVDAMQTIKQPKGSLLCQATCTAMLCRVQPDYFDVWLNMMAGLNRISHYANTFSKDLEERSEEIREYERMGISDLRYMTTGASMCCLGEVSKGFGVAWGVKNGWHEFTEETRIELKFNPLEYDAMVGVSLPPDPQMKLSLGEGKGHTWESVRNNPRRPHTVVWDSAAQCIRDPDPGKYNTGSLSEYPWINQWIPISDLPPGPTLV